jgi:hypothetical protein
MAIVGHRDKVKRYGGYLLALVMLFSLFSISFASSNLNAALATLCTTGQAVLGGIVMLLIVLAGVSYAIGQVMGAETRARATVWATAMLTGAVIGAIIYLVMPPVIVAMTGMPASCTAASQTGGTLDQACYNGCMNACVGAGNEHTYCNSACMPSCTK